MNLICIFYLNIQTISDKLGAQSTYPQCAYMRYMNFGGWKAAFKPTGYVDAMMVQYSADGQGSLNWNGTTSNLSANLNLYNRGATSGAGVVKQVIVIGYLALTGEQRLNFDVNSWRALNGGKGLSFDLKVIDKDSDDPTAIPSGQNYSSADYWWSSTSNDGYLATWFSGFLKPASKTTALNDVNAKAKSIFARITSNKIELTQTADVTIYNSIGKLVNNFKKINSVSISDLKSGVYMIKANGQILKIVR